MCEIYCLHIARIYRKSNRLYEFDIFIDILAISAGAANLAYFRIELWVNRLLQK